MEIEQRLEALFGRPVDIVAERVAKEPLARSIERDRLVAFGKPLRRLEDVPGNLRRVHRP